MSLLKKAQEAKANNARRPIVVTEEHVELLIAYLDGKVSLAQVGIALELPRKNSQSAIYQLIQIIRDGYRRGLVKVINPKK